MTQKKLSVREFYSQVWGEYADPLYHPITAKALVTQRQVVARRIEQEKPRRLLDLGCGPAPVIDCESAERLVFADLVFEMLLLVKRNRSGSVVCLDAERLPFRSRCFDFVWCGLLADHIRNPKVWIKELFRVLAPGSTLGMACWDRSTLPLERYPQNNQMRYTTAKGDELSVASYPTWEETLRNLMMQDPCMEVDSYPIVPDQYLLQVAWVRVRVGGRC